MCTGHVVYNFSVFIQSSLHYYSELNNFQQKKKYAVLDPLLSFMHAQVQYKPLFEFINKACV